MTYYINANPNILQNDDLREPQVGAYKQIIKYFSNTTDRKEAIITLPTGTGKTGLMAIAPFGISKIRTLIITPQTVVQNSVMGTLDSRNYKNFWLFSKVFENQNECPVVIEYNKDITVGTLNRADLVVLNIHKLQERLQSSLLNLVDKNFFDLIIIDEAHHSEAYTWKRTVEYFENANVIKVTGTPFRSDGKEISGENIYSYPLSKAMVNGYVKSLEKFTYIPEKIEFTIDNEDKIYSLEELRDLNLKDNEWISRQVALSESSNLSIIKKSIEKLNKLKENTNNPHKIVAVACSITHAKQLNDLYKKEGLNSAIVHSDLDKSTLEKEFSKIDNHEVDVVINVALLGEGYDHKFLTIAAIFRPFRSDLPYQQFIGRVLRSISPADTVRVTNEDNIAKVIHHKELGLNDLWNAYKNEIEKSNIIKDIRREKRNTKEYERSELVDGEVFESDKYEISSDTFIDTSLLKMRRHKEKQQQQKIKALMDALGNIDEATARKMLAVTEQSNERLLRPDLHQLNLRKEFDDRIHEEIIPDILQMTQLDLHGYELYNRKSNVFPLPVQRILSKQSDNGACLAIYINTSLKSVIGSNRSKWEIEDYDKASEELIKIIEFIQKRIIS